jgi:hypothetical protein
MRIKAASQLAKDSPLCRRHPPAAEAEIDFAGLTVRLEAAPFQSVTRTWFFHNFFGR